MIWESSPEMQRYGIFQLLRPPRLNSVLSYRNSFWRITGNLWRFCVGLFGNAPSVFCRECSCAISWTFISLQADGNFVADLVQHVFGLIDWFLLLDRGFSDFFFWIRLTFFLPGYPLRLNGVMPDVENSRLFEKSFEWKLCPNRFISCILYLDRFSF